MGSMAHVGKYSSPMDPMGHGVKSLSNRSGIPTCCSEMVQECSRDKVLDLSLWFLGWLRRTLDDFDVSSMIGHILYVYMIHTFWDIFFWQQFKIHPQQPVVFSQSSTCVVSVYFWCYESTMVVSRWFFQGSLHYSRWRLKHCKSWTLNVWYVCQHLPTKINHSWFMLDVIFHTGRWRWRGLWWMRDWWLNSMQT